MSQPKKVVFAAVVDVAFVFVVVTAAIVVSVVVDGAKFVKIGSDIFKLSPSNNSS